MIKSVLYAVEKELGDIGELINDFKMNIKNKDNQKVYDIIKIIDKMVHNTAEIKYNDDIINILFTILTFRYFITKETHKMIINILKSLKDTHRGS